MECIDCGLWLVCADGLVSGLIAGCFWEMIWFCESLERGFVFGWRL